MKKGLILDLIKYYTRGDDSEFKRIAYEIAGEFEVMGDNVLSDEILRLLEEPSNEPALKAYVRRLSFKNL